MRQAEARWRQNIFRKLSERLLCLPERLMLNTTRHKQFLITKECAIVWLDALVAFPWTAISSSANICLAVCKLALRISICSSFATANYLITRPAFTPKPHQISIKHSACFSITSMLSRPDDAEHFFNTEQLWILGQCLHEISLCSPLYHSLSSSFLFRAVSQCNEAWNGQHDVFDVAAWASRNSTVR